jgi:hypothetical protein
MKFYLTKTCVNKSYVFKNGYFFSAKKTIIPLSNMELKLAANIRK